jgi:hypothetical protein
MPTADEPRVTVRLSSATHGGLVRIAGEEGCSVGALLRRLADSLVAGGSVPAGASVSVSHGTSTRRLAVPLPEGVRTGADLLRERQARLNKQLGWGGKG